jgi:asparagine synthase (glutamine-hydrolysing)
MCGIAGVFGVSAPEVVERMLLALAHRGPDDQYCVSGPDFSLGARRLAILDLQGGRQPMRTPGANPVWACQNGEIYNFAELRRTLLAEGHQLVSRSDTEVIPHLYQRYGADCVTHLQGMFALAVYQGGRGLLARDRSGKKPLYYLEQGGALWFASEIKALLLVPGFERRLSLQATHHFLSLKNVPAPLTAFEGISALPPAHVLTWSQSRTQLQRYWRLDWTPLEGDPSEAELAEELLSRLDSAVKRRLVADVPVGLFLSGGLDSSLSTALAASVSKPKTFTLRYGADSTTPGKELDVRVARQVASLYGTEHHEEELDFSRFQEELPAILRCFDEPFSGVMSTYFLSRLIARHVKVAISGDGADELFGSYLSHRLARPIHEFARGKRDDLGHFADQQEFLASIASPDDWEWRSRLWVFSDEEKRDLYASASGPEHLQPTREWLRGIFSDLSATDPLNRVLEAEFLTQLPDQVLAFSDRLSMAHSLELRTAFLDTAVMELAARIPGKFKIRGQETKSVLKTAARRHLPPEAVDRPKEGFVMPVNQWLGSWLLDFARATLGTTRLARHGLFRPAAVQQLLDNFAAGEQRLANKVLSLLCWQLWFDLYFHQPSGPTAEGSVEHLRA